MCHASRKRTHTSTQQQQQQQQQQQHVISGLSSGKQLLHQINFWRKRAYYKTERTRLAFNDSANRRGRVEWSGVLVGEGWGQNLPIGRSNFSGTCRILARLEHVITTRSRSFPRLLSNCQSTLRSRSIHCCLCRFIIRAMGDSKPPLLNRWLHYTTKNWNWRMVSDERLSTKPYLDKQWEWPW